MTPLTRVLHVDDEVDLRDVVAMVLETVGGYTVASCGSGQEALEKAAAFAPDLILLDVMMPGMDGPTTLQALRRNPATAGIPVIFMTAKVEPDALQRYRDLGALGFISKPFKIQAFCDQIGEMWIQAKSAPDSEMPST